MIGLELSHIRDLWKKKEKLQGVIEISNVEDHGGGGRHRVADRREGGGEDEAGSTAGARCSYSPARTACATNKKLFVVKALIFFVVYLTVLTVISPRKENVCFFNPAAHLERRHDNLRLTLSSICMRVYVRTARALRSAHVHRRVHWTPINDIHCAQKIFLLLD